MAIIDLDYVPNKWAEPFHKSTVNNTCLVGGLGSGKSVAGVEELKMLALENPGFTYLIGRKTLPSLRDTTMKTFFSRMEDGLVKRHDKTHNIVKFMNGAEFIFRPLDDMEKMKSLEIAGFFVDEANEISQDMYNTLKSRVRQKIKGKDPTIVFAR
jgi:phage terminase large subunit